MSLIQKIEKDLNTALKASDKVVLSTLRFLMASVKNLEIEKLRELSDEETIGVIQKQIKQRQESITAFKAGKREDLVSKESQELEILSKYLPEQLAEEDLQKIISDTIKDLNAGPADFGKVMKEVMIRVKGKADGHQVVETVKKFLIQA